MWSAVTCVRPPQFLGPGGDLMTVRHLMQQPAGDTQDTGGRSFMGRLKGEWVCRTGVALAVKSRKLQNG